MTWSEEEVIKIFKSDFLSNLPNRDVSKIRNANDGSDLSSVVLFGAAENSFCSNFSRTFFILNSVVA